MTDIADDPIGALTRALGGDPPASLDDLDPVLVSRLADAITAESRRQQQAIEQAVDDALRLVPRPLRGIVKKMIRP